MKTYITCLAVALLFAGVSQVNATTVEGFPNDGLPSICYDFLTGVVMIYTDGNNANTYILDSAAGIFTGAPPVLIGGTFFTTDNDFRISENFFNPTLNGGHNLGPVAQAGLSKAFLLNDLTLQGGLSGNPNFDFDLIVKNAVPPVPEPATIVLIGVGLLGLIGWRRSRRAA